MNKRELAAKVAVSANVHQGTVEKVINGVLAEIRASLVQEEPVRMNGFGTFYTWIRSARTARNPKTGEEVLVPATRVVKFRPSRALKDRVADGE